MVTYNVWERTEKELGMEPIPLVFDTEADAQQFFDDAGYSEYADAYVIEAVS